MREFWWYISSCSYATTSKEGSCWNNTNEEQWEEYQEKHRIWRANINRNQFFNPRTKQEENVKNNLLLRWYEIRMNKRILHLQRNIFRLHSNAKSLNRSSLSWGKVNVCTRNYIRLPHCLFTILEDLHYKFYSRLTFKTTFNMKLNQVLAVRKELMKLCRKRMVVEQWK